MVLYFTLPFLMLSPNIVLQVIKHAFIMRENQLMHTRTKTKSNQSRIRKASQTWFGFFFDNGGTIIGSITAFRFWASPSLLLDNGNGVEGNKRGVINSVELETP
ncbi:hypothetical protein VIGAN_01103800 [Vigna angularis var. angularis]|uniref:Uncharacterized protein n=1 Tax=Vigna angularis var. angularis TaxID=157739 RepID=A0A0S3QZ14_PHAAN|nr:hypothetical protein VIGAN_01103800 [Vigna angularis var. angularis]